MALDEGRREVVVTRRLLSPPWVVSLLLASLLAALSATTYFAAGIHLDPRLASPRAANVWFDSDLPYRLETMLHPSDGMHHGGAHPLFPTVARVLMGVAGAFTVGSLEPRVQAHLATALAGGVWVAALFLLFRRMGLDALEATVFAALGGVSAGGLFWFSVPETFAVAGLGVTVALIVAAAARPSVVALTVACVASASCILTNGVAGGLAVSSHCWGRREWRRALGAFALTLGTMAAVWTAQEWGRGSPFFISHQLLEYRQHTFPVTLERTSRVVPALISHSMVAPGLRNDRPKFRRMPLGSSGPVGVGATVAWWGLLVLGSAGMFRLARRREHLPLLVTTVGSLAFMVAMHLTLGREMFLYAMNVLPPLLVVVALSVRRGKRGRGLALALACVLLVLGGINNVMQFRKAAESASDLAQQRVAGAKIGDTIRISGHHLPKSSDVRIGDTIPISDHHLPKSGHVPDSPSRPKVFLCPGNGQTPVACSG
jgi:hypothetical protein